MKPPEEKAKGSLSPGIPENWEEEFTKRFVIGKNRLDQPYVTNPVEVKSFIRNLLQQQRSEVASEIRKIIGEKESTQQVGFGFDDRVRVGNRNELRDEQLSHLEAYLKENEE